MRIIAGDARGRRIAAPKGNNTRPTADKVREAIFSSIAAYVPDAHVLDAFAGSGALALEALSRGAENAVLIESDRSAFLCCEENIQKTGFSSCCTLLKGDCLKILPRYMPGKPCFDLIFADPPYDLGLLPKFMQMIAENRYLSPEGLLIAETRAENKDFCPKTGWEIVKEAFYGDTAVHYCRLQSTSF